MKLHYAVRIIRYGILGLLILTGGFSCRTYETHAVRTQEWPGVSPETMRDAGVGFFESTGNARGANSQKNLYDALAFALREQGYITRESDFIQKVLKNNDLPDDRLLTEAEITRMTREFGGRLYLQGRIEETRTIDVVEERVQIMVNVWIYDARRGEKIGEIKLFGTDLEYNTGRESLDMSRLIVADLERLILEREE
ncbi:MAG: hypothetical protein KDK27_05465 [Leptospiraceae bacterium]|nr:hypothetical protein [Leptospiraceae bacterium]